MVQYMQHRSGSRKGRVRTYFDQHGKESTIKFGRSLGLAESTLRSWISTWRNQGPAHTNDRARAGERRTGSVKIRLGPDGRIVVPAGFREVLGLKEGDVLFGRLEDGEIHLLTPQTAARRAQSIIRQFVPEGVSLVDELIEDRRREVEHESQE
jgi:antitoxin PrlF